MQMTALVAQMAEMNQTLLQQLAQRPAPVPVAPAQPPPDGGHADSHNLLRATVLRNLSLPTFDGVDPTSFPAFWDTFQLRIRDSRLSDPDKFEALRGLLSGQAAAKLGGLVACQPGAFEEASRILVANYNDGQIHKGLAVQRIHSLPHMLNLDCSSLESFSDQLRVAAGQLRRLEEPAEALDLLVYSIWDRLPLTYQTEIRTDRAKAGKPRMPSMIEFQATMDDTLNILRASRPTAAPLPYAGLNLAGVTNAGSGKPNRNSNGRSDGNASNSYKKGGGGGQQSRNGPRPSRDCVYCDGADHTAINCGKVRGAVARLAIVRTKGLCRNCLGLHYTNRCPSSRVCSECAGKHHTSLHGGFPDNRGTNSNQTQPPTRDAPNPSPASNAAGNSNSLVSSTETGGLQPTMMATFSAKAINPSNGKSFFVNVLIDSGSSYTHLDSVVKSKLGLHSLKSLTIGTSVCHSRQKRQVKADLVSFCLSTEDGSLWPLQALATQDLAAPIHIPAVQLPQDIRKTLASIRGPTANLPPSVDKEIPLHLIVGGDYAQLLVGPRVPALALRPTLTAHLTQFGAIITGSLADATAANGTACLSFGTVLSANSFLSGAQPGAQLSLEQLLDRTTNLEMLGLDQGSTKPPPQDDTASRQLMDSAFRDSDGRYVIALPLRPGVEDLPSNFGQAWGRAQANHRRLSQKERQLYYGEFEKRKEEGVLEPVPKDKATEKTFVHYLPHFPVYKYAPAVDGSTEKIVNKVRPVVDASAKTSLNGLSLNDYLDSGPNLLNSLVQVYLIHRIHRFAVTSDLKAAFYSVGLQQQFRDAFRIILPNDYTKPLLQGNFSLYRFTRIVMGASPSPWILLAVLAKICSEAISSKDSDLSQAELETMMEGLYVDNCVMGFDNEGDAKRAVPAMCHLFHKSAFHLREFASNLPGCLDSLPDDDRLPGDTVPFLGLFWDTKEDFLRLKTPSLPEASTLTRTSLCSAAHLVYDPSGYLAPVVLAIRLFNRYSFQNNDPWTKEADEDVKAGYRKLRADLLRVAEVPIPRYLLQDRKAPARLVLYSDGAPNAYGCCIYVWQELDGIISCNLALAKFRLVPSSSKGCMVTVPRVELLAAVMATRAATALISSLASRLSFISVTHYIDSQVVLYWLANGTKLRTYESRRVSEVNEAKLTEDRRYVRSNENPADACTKPLSLDALLKSRFHVGPQHLQQPFKDWPNWTAPAPDPDLLEGTPPRRKVKIQTNALVSVVAGSKPCAPADMDLTRFQRLDILLGATVYASRFQRLLRGKGPPSYEERQAALLRWVHYAQVEQFADVMEALQKNQGKKYKIVHQLDLSLDKLGLLRLGSRFGNAPMNADSKYPLLLPSSHRLTQLLALHHHTTNSHAPVGTTLNLLRVNFWIPKGRVTVSRALRTCMNCNYTKGKPLRHPVHGQLPEERLQPGLPAFSSILIDQLGPVLVCDPATRTPAKRWALLLTCAVSRALHIERLWDYSADSVVQGFERFWARRGLTECTIWLDQATAFHGAATAVQTILSSHDHLHSALQPLTAGRSLRFRFAPVRAPWTQGAVERLVGLVKASLRPSLWRKHITDEDLITIFAKVEAMVNTRPLTPVSTNPEDSKPLTPADLVAPKVCLSLPALQDQDFLRPTGSQTVDRLLSAYRRRELILNEFWSRWTHEYLSHLRSTHLQQRQRGHNTVVGPRLGHMYLLADRNPRGTWKTCRVTRLRPDKTGVVRTVDVVTSTGHQAQYSVTHLVPLECDPLDEASPNEDLPVEERTVPDFSARHHRAKRRNELRDALFES
jgi:hypothetical protein